MKTRITAERALDAPADLLYHLLADYTTHHRPEGFLPPAFTDLRVLAGGVGDGTEATWNVDTNGARRSIHAWITEPDPGHTLLETADGLVTTFTVDPTPAGARVRFETVIDEPGLRGLITRLFAPRMLAPLYEEELTSLGEYARTHGPLDA